MTSAIVDSLF